MICNGNAALEKNSKSATLLLEERDCATVLVIQQYKRSKFPKIIYSYSVLVHVCSNFSIKDA